MNRDILQALVNKAGPSMGHCRKPVPFPMKKPNIKIYTTVVVGGAASRYGGQLRMY